MANGFFDYRPLRDEVGAKIESLSRPVAEQSTSLLRGLGEIGMAPDDIARARDLVAALEACPFDAIYANYLSHPVRMTAAFLRERPQAGFRGVALALCHNFRETAVAGQDEIERQFLEDGVRRSLDVLFTDRSRERDPAYLIEFYDGIAKSEDLMLLKGHDKLDNFLSYVLHDLDPYHFDVVSDWVLPRLRPVNAQLADYLAALLAYASDPEMKLLHRSPASTKHPLNA